MKKEQKKNFLTTSIPFKVCNLKSSGIGSRFKKQVIYRLMRLIILNICSKTRMYKFTMTYISTMQCLPILLRLLTSWTKLSKIMNSLMVISLEHSSKTIFMYFKMVLKKCFPDRSQLELDSINIIMIELSTMSLTLLSWWSLVYFLRLYLSVFCYQLFFLFIEQTTKSFPYLGTYLIKISWN